MKLLRRGLIWGGAILLAMVLLLVLGAAVLDAGYLRGPLIKLIARNAGRPIRVDGALRVHILSRNPMLSAERVTIGNPSWVPPGSMAKIGKLTLVLATPRLGRGLTIESIDLNGAVLSLVQDQSGHANWQRTNPDENSAKRLPIIRSFSMPGAQVRLEDAQKQRHFTGMVSVSDDSASGALQPLRMSGKGQLNGRPVRFELLGDPLRTASYDKHYGFSFSESSSGSHLVGSGFLLHALDVTRYDASYEATGADLKDMYYLTGTHLIDTGSYRLSGKLQRRGYISSFSNLHVTSGQSDMRGTVTIDTTHGRSIIDAELNSQLLKLADLGLRAAGREPTPDPDAGRLLSNVAPDPSEVRRSVARLKFQAKLIQAGRVSLSAVVAKLSNDHGVMAAPLSADLLGGKLNAQIKIDAVKQLPAASLQLKIVDFELGRIFNKKPGPPPLEGAASLRLSLAGRGKSLREVAASADGSLTATLPSGMLRASLAELTGIELRGLGLLLTKNKQQVPIRCGIASFEAHDGTLAARDLVLDTQPVLIVGEGFIHLDSETLDLALRGYLKKVRLFQLRAPIAIRGTLKAPSIGVEAKQSKLVFIDRGKANDADCASLLK